ncbi:MAG: DUF433 domain-containing protein [Gemmatimonadetes bacterium]|jgi:uncharacterized protein (DUF433 family)/transposase-like protein|nr:DUF433 domain-containing protein [Gemmatimonadota bacterium]
MTTEFSLYRGRDPRELPAYSIADAARYVDVPRTTLRSWVAGRTYPRRDDIGTFESLITPADPQTNRLSFYNLVEAHVLRALRNQHAVPLQHIRPAITYAENALGISRLLLSRDLLTSAGQVFVEHLEQLINLSKSGQLYVKELLDNHLKRVEWDDRAIPIRLFPFIGHSTASLDKPIVIDPNIGFGRPTVSGSGIFTSVLVQRIDAGESVEDLAKDYGLPEEQIKAAVLFEQAA